MCFGMGSSGTAGKAPQPGDINPVVGGVAGQRVSHCLHHRPRSRNSKLEQCVQGCGLATQVARVKLGVERGLVGVGGGRWAREGAGGRSSGQPAGILWGG